ncbi:hypothetical protein [Streptomyces sp. ODS28]|uniref:hypothetical protein n=1 Tax=Streptomyces sp. ODS28 TaxID=3136688 RepID=UPI0031F17D02
MAIYALVLCAITVFWPLIALIRLPWPLAAAVFSSAVLLLSIAAVAWMLAQGGDGFIFAVFGPSLLIASWRLRQSLRRLARAGRQGGTPRRPSLRNGGRRLPQG